jgi:hypothetical protein
MGSVGCETKPGLENEMRRVQREVSNIIEFEGRRFLMKYGRDVYMSVQSRSGEYHFRRVPHTYTRIIEAVRALARPAAATE